MINIVIWSNNYAEIEEEKHEITSSKDVINFLKALLDKAYYSGETICLEHAITSANQSEVNFVEIERYNHFMDHKIIQVGDKIWWSLELIKQVKEEGGENIMLIVEKIETSLDGSKIIWMKKADKSSIN